MNETFKSYLRPLKFGFLRRQAEFLAGRAGPFDAADATRPIAYLVACGRSGTTILGRVLSNHPDVCYLFEPGHLWAAIDPLTDCINLYHRLDPRCLMDADLCDGQTRLRFRRLMYGKLARSGRKLLLEKTPVNAMRLGYLDALTPHARYIHLVRDGANVSRSISSKATKSTYKLASRPTWNQWWGADGIKWPTLARDGAAAGYYPTEVQSLASHLEKGVYEWLVSLHEVDRRREAIGDRLLEFTYSDLTADPGTTLGAICEFLGVETDREWLNQATTQIGEERHNRGDAIALPEEMCRDFNAFQERFGFVNRAVPSDTSD